MIILEDLTKKYYTINEKPLVVFNEVNFSFPSKGFITLTGKSGSGKSTLFNILGGIDNDFDGDVKSFGLDVRNCDLAGYRSDYVGFIFQDFSLIENLTVFDNLKLVLSEHKNHIDDMDSKILDVLSKLGLTKLKLRYPNQISGGEAQRVAIARALLKEVKYILADEPTGNLDKENAIEVLNLLKEVSKEKLVILVTHDVDLASNYSDCTYTVDELKNNNSNVPNDYIEVEQENNKKNISSFMLSYPFKMLKRNRFSTILMNLLLLFVLFLSFLSLKTVSITDYDMLSSYFNSNNDENYSVQEVTFLDLDNGGVAVKTNKVIDDVYEAYNIFLSYTDKNNVFFSNKIMYKYLDEEDFERPLATRVTLLKDSDAPNLNLKVGRLPEEEDELVITDYMSMLFFNTEDSIGFKIEGNNGSRYIIEYTIVGVIETDYLSSEIPLNESDFITMFEHTTVLSPETSYGYFEMSKYVQSYTIIETYSLNDEQHLLGSDAYLNIKCAECAQNYRITRSIEYDPSHNIYGSYPNNENEFILRLDLLREILPSSTDSIDQLINGEINWAEFTTLIDLPSFYNDIALTSGEKFWDGILPDTYNITGVYESSENTIEIMYVSPELISIINEHYPFREIGITVINPDQVLDLLTNESFEREIKRVYSPNVGSEQIVFNGLNSHQSITSQYRFVEKIQPPTLISFIVTILLSFILLLLHGSNSFKIYGRSIGILMSLGFNKWKLILTLVIETIYLLLLPLILSIILLVSFSDQLSKVLFSSEVTYSIYQFSPSDIIVFIFLILCISLLSMLPRIISILRKSPIDLIRKR